MTDVFISYSRKDSDFARRLTNELEKRNQDVWIDWQDIPRGADWLNEIYSGIESADIFLLIVSQHSLTSQICNDEIAYARRVNKRIVPIIRENIEGDTEKIVKGTWLDVPWQDTARANWDAVKHINWLVFNEDIRFDSEFQALIKTLDEDLPHRKAHTRYLVRALDWERGARNPSFLMIGDEIATAEKWLLESGEKQPPPDPLHRDYIAASRKAEDDRHAFLSHLTTRTRQFRFAAVALGIVGLSALTLSIFSVLQASDSTSRAGTATIALGQAVFGQQTAVGRENQASTQVAVAGQTIAPVPQTIAAANQQIATSQQQLLIANSTLTPIPVTLTVLAQQVQQQTDFTYSLRLANLALELNDSSSFRLAQLALPVALAANNVPSPPSQAQKTLADLAYAPGPRRLYNSRWAGAVLSPDGRTALSNMGNTLLLWDLASGEVIQTYEGLQNQIAAMAFSPDGEMVAAGEWHWGGGEVDANLIVWNTQTGTQLYHLQGHKSLIYDIVFSPDGHYIASGGGDSYGDSAQFFLWDATDGRLIHEFKGHHRPITSLVFSPDSQYLLSGAGDHDEVEVFLWDVKTQKLLRTFPDHEGTGLLGQSVDIAYSPDGQTILTASADKIFWWDVATGEQRRVYNEPGYHIVYSPDGQFFLYTSLGKLYMREVETGDLIFETPIYSGFAGNVNFMPDGQQALIASSNGPMIWGLTSGAQIRTYERHRGRVMDVDFSSDGDRVAAAAQDGYFSVWHVKSGELLWIFEGGLPSVVSLSPDNRLLAAGDWGGNIGLYDLQTGQLIHLLSSPKINEEEFSNEIFDLDFSPDGKTLASVGRNNLVVLWDVASGQVINQLAGHLESTFGSTSVVFSPDGHYIASGGSDMQIILWNADTGEIVHTFLGHGGCLNPEIQALAFSPDSRSLASGGCDSKVILWDINTGTRIKTFVGHTREDLWSVAFTPDGKYLLSADGRTILWDVETGFPLEIFPGFVSAISPDGHFALTSTGVNLTLWRLDSLDSLIEWTRHNRVLWPPSCQERESLAMQPLCDEAGNLPLEDAFLPRATDTVPAATWTLMPPTPGFSITWTPIPSPTASNTPTQTPIPSPTPTQTPSPTPVQAQPAQLGSNRGEITLGSYERWIYEGKAGEVLTITVLADHPGSGNDPYTFVQKGLFDPLLVVIDPNGNWLATNDDRDGTPLPNGAVVDTDSELGNLVLPMNGEYEIDIQSAFGGQTAGKYTLVIESDLSSTPTPTMTPTPEL